MSFLRIEPAHELKNLVECYWAVEDDSLNMTEQKIIPDGFPEMIFHFGDSYEIKLTNHWERQPMALLAGQLTNYFYLRNTGCSIIFGIKFKPCAIAQLFNLSMHSITDKVVGLHTALPGKLEHLIDLLQFTKTHAQRKVIIDKQLIEIIPKVPPARILEKAITMIFATHGVIPVTELCDALKTSERKLERHFKDQIGLSPKFYTRIIRFSYVFEVLQKKKMSWSELGLECGFYDQSHFIKNFKQFTGEDPSHYLFGEVNLANFFLKK